MSQILSRALKGLDGMFKFTGDKTAPGELDSDSPITVVADMTQLGRYGSAFHSNEDGWWRLAVNIAGVAGTAQTQTSFEWDTGTDDVVPQDFKMGWVYGVTLRVVAAGGATISEFDNAIFQINSGEAIHLGSRASFEVFHSDELMIQDITAPSNNGFALPRVNTLMSPWLWHRSEFAFMINNQTSVAGTLAYEWAFMMRFTRDGVPPLPF